MLVSFLYSITLVIVCAYALGFGGSAERQTAILRLIASTGSLLGALLTSNAWAEMLTSVAIIDALSCAASFAIMVRSRANWTIVSFGFTTSEVFANIARSLQGHLPALAYYGTETIWGYPLLTVLAIGTWQHRRRARASSSRVSSAQA